MKSKETKRQLLVKNTLSIFFMLVFLIFLVPSTYAACVRNLEQTLSELNRTLPSQNVVVSNATELATAVSQANSSGNITILLKDGTYQIAQQLYISGDNIAFRSLSGDRNKVIIRGKGMNGNLSHVFNVVSSYFTLADLTIGWVANHPVQIHGESNADYPLIHNVRVVDGGEQLFKVSKSNTNAAVSNNGLVEWSVFEYSAGVGPQWYIGGLVANGAHGWIVRNNEFRGIRSPGTGMPNHAIHFRYGSTNTIIENNVIINCDRGIGFGLSDSNHKGGIIRNNMVYTTRDVGIGLERAINAKVYNNTVYTLNYPNSIEFRFPETVASITNNLTNRQIVKRDGGSGTLTNNVTNAQEGWFVDAVNGDLHLSTSITSVVDQGITLSQVVRDFACEVRGNGTYDIGADEFVEASVPENMLTFGSTGTVIDQSKTSVWHSIVFGTPFVNTPVMLADIQTHLGGEPAGLRMQNLTNGDAKIKIEEDKSANNESNHLAENVGYLAISSGLIKNAAGEVIGEAQSIDAKTMGDTHWESITLLNEYTQPVVRMQMVTFNKEDPGHIRLRNVGSTSFEYQIEEWDYDDQLHDWETLNYVVVEAGEHSLSDNRRLIAGTVDIAADGSGAFTKIMFPASFAGAPVVLSQSQTYNDPAAIVTRQKDIDEKRVKIRLVEEEAADQIHGYETVGYLAIGTKGAGGVTSPDEGPGNGNNGPTDPDPGQELPIPTPVPEPTLPTPVPEPSTIALFAFGLAVLLGSRRKSFTQKEK